VKPSVGRIVHYVSYGTPGGEFPSTCRAAIITEVPPEPAEDAGLELVGLFVANPEGLFLNRNVPHVEGQPSGGTWHWPERVEE
jgi:hypothetical protein